MIKNDLKKKKRWIKDAKEHEDQNDHDGRTLLVSQVIIWDISVYHIIFLKRSWLKVLNPRYGKQWLLGFSWKIMPQVFLERVAL